MTTQSPTPIGRIPTNVTTMSEHYSTALSLSVCICLLAVIRAIWKR